ncbi:MAG: hypothetical protein ACXU82_01705 [Caulobacteraceae bacterium]
MKTFKNIIIASTAVLAVSGAVTSVAQAQPGRYYDRGYDYRGGRVDHLSTSYVDSLDWQIQNAAREGRISWREARDLRNELNRVKPLAYRYQTGQARQWEVNRLERTVDRIDNEVRG